jgi:hypothetical protein
MKCLQCHHQLTIPTSMVVGGDMTREPFRWDQRWINIFISNDTSISPSPLSIMASIMKGIQDSRVKDGLSYQIDLGTNLIVYDETSMIETMDILLGNKNPKDRNFALLEERCVLVRLKGINV